MSLWKGKRVLSDLLAPPNHSALASALSDSTLALPDYTYEPLNWDIIGAADESEKDSEGEGVPLY